MFAVIFICGNLFLWIAGKIAKIAKIRTCENFGKVLRKVDKVILLSQKRFFFVVRCVV